MKPLFPEWGNSVYRSTLAAFALALVGIPVFLMAWVRTPYATGKEELVTQPIKFDHRHHARDDGIDCLYCHGAATKSAYAGVPATSLCMNCHDQVWTASPELTQVRESYFRDEPIAWRRVNTLPDHVYFNHSVHLAKGVGCVTCHGRVDQMAQVFQAEDLSMAFCIDCHRSPQSRLRPLDRVTDLEWSASTASATARPLLEVHPTTDCSGCHR